MQNQTEQGHKNIFPDSSDFLFLMTHTRVNSKNRQTNKNIKVTNLLTY